MDALREPSKVLRLVGRYMHGVDLVGYQITDLNGLSMQVSKAEAEQLALDGFIVNCTLIELEHKRYIKGVGIRISELPVLNTRTGEIKNSQIDGAKTVASLTIVARLKQGQSVVGYIVKDTAGKQYRLSNEKVWELCRNKKILRTRCK